jgi:hypothetical protein
MVVFPAPTMTPGVILLRRVHRRSRLAGRGGREGRQAVEHRYRSYVSGVQDVVDPGEHSLPPGIEETMRIGDDPDSEGTRLAR